MQNVNVKCYNKEKLLGSTASQPGKQLSKRTNNNNNNNDGHSKDET